MPTVNTNVAQPPAEVPGDPALAEWISHAPIGCLVEGHYADIEAAIDPASEVAEARLYFGNQLTKDSVEYWTRMLPVGDRFVARLPRPMVSASPVRYRIEARREDGRLASTDLQTAVVVSAESGCPEGSRVARRASSDEAVTVY